MAGLRNDQHDRERAAKWDALVPELPEDMRHVLEYNAWKMTVEYASEEFTETMAKSFLYGLLVLITASPEERADMIDNGEAVRAAYEWKSVTH